VRAKKCNLGKMVQKKTGFPRQRENLIQAQGKRTKKTSSGGGGGGGHGTVSKRQKQECSGPGKIRESKVIDKREKGPSGSGRNVVLQGGVMTSPVRGSNKKTKEERNWLSQKKKKRKSAGNPMEGDTGVPRAKTTPQVGISGSCGESLTCEGHSHTKGEKGSRAEAPSKFLG